MYFMLSLKCCIITKMQKGFHIMDVLSLIVLVAAIAIAFACKVNTGLVAIALSLVIGRIAGLSDKWLLNSFDSSLFLMLFGVMYLFCIAQENKTLELLAKKLLALCRGKLKLFPPLLFLISAVLSAIGPGPISVTALMSVLIVALATETGTHPVKLLPFGALGAFAGGLSPISPSGIVANSVATESGIAGLAFPLFWQMALAMSLYAAILYFVFKWHKQTDIAPARGATERIPAFSWKQWLTLAGIIAVALLSTVLGVNVGLAAFAVSVLLTICRAADESAAFKKVPWGTLVMITGMGILISLVTELKGIELLSQGLSAFMSRYTATPLMTILGGVMSWFSSASGVVMPTLIPTVPDISATLSGLQPLELTVGLCIGAHAAAVSPLSSCGALMLAAYSSSGNIDIKERNKTFTQLFVISAAGVLFCALLSFTGIYG